MPKRAPKRLKTQPEPEAQTLVEGQATAAAGPSTSRLPSPRLFHPFRALGFVCDHIPISIHVHQAKGALATPHVNILTSVGRSWLMWDAGRMTLVFVGKSPVFLHRPMPRACRPSSEVDRAQGLDDVLMV